MSDRAVDVNSSELWVTLDANAPYDTTRGAVEAVASGYPGLATSVSTYTADQLDSARQGGRGDLVVRVFGNDLSALQKTARQVQAAVRTVPGVTAASVSAQQQEPAAQVVVDLQAAANYGLRPGDVRRQATTMMSGLLVGNLYENQAVFDVVVQGPAATTQSLTSLVDMPIDVPSGGQVPLRNVAAVHLGPEPTVIRHEGVSRAIDVGVTVAGGGRDVQAGVEAAVRSVAMPAEFHAEVSVSPGSPLAPDRRWPLLAMVATMVALLLLQAATRSWRLGVGLLLSLGVVVAVGLLAASLAGSTTVVGVLGGLLAGLGLAARQGVVLVRTVRDGASGSDARTVIVNHALRRAGPVLLSAMATASVLVPALLVGDRPGLELLRPFSAAALGSLLAAVLVVLLVVPVLCLLGGVASLEQAALPLSAPTSSSPGTGRPRRWRRS
jgi:Cu/Ag efflux pump CusA